MHLVNVGIDSGRYPTTEVYPFNVDTLRNTAELTLRRPVVFFEGENGTGKSTLLEAITRKAGIH
ncbi:MAG: AAA family ATPase, partial [Anaerolineales bacterium]